MSAITATEARKSLFGLIQQVNDDHTAVEVVSRHGNAVILSKDDYDAMTVHVFPKYQEHLRSCAAFDFDDAPTAGRVWPKPKPIPASESKLLARLPKDDNDPT